MTKKLKQLKFKEKFKDNVWAGLKCCTIRPTEKTEGLIIGDTIKLVFSSQALKAEVVGMRRIKIFQDEPIDKVVCDCENMEEAQLKKEIDSVYGLPFKGSVIYFNVIGVA